MNRPGTMPQTMRGMPGNFGNPQPPQQSGRAVSNRLPNGKLANNSPSWAFSGSTPMGSAGLPNAARQMGGNISFAQSLSGSQPATPLDLSEFPSLSNNPQLPSASQSSLWSTANSGSRNPSGNVPRNQSTPGSQHVGGQEDLFSQASSRAASTQGSFRFGNQGSIPPSSQAPPSAIDEFPPLNRNANGEIGSERGQSLMSSLGFGSQGNGSDSAPPSSRGNGLLNALSANTRQTESRTPRESSRSQDPTSPRSDDNDDSKAGSLRDTMSPGSENRNPLGAIGLDVSKLKGEKENRPPDAVDPLAGMSESDKWGIKGLRTLMNNYPDYHAMVVGMDPHSLGLDLGTPDLISKQSYSLFDDSPPRPTVTATKARLPDCYNVTNVQPLESKIQSFNEETLFWIFYSCPLDLKQQLAATELHSRNWRWHKKLHVWLTKDEHMTPQILSPSHERGWYIIWDTAQWRKDRREFTLHYNDLDTSLGQGAVGP